MTAETTRTTNHEKIRTWAEARGGKPATIADTEGAEGQPGVLRIHFPDYSQDDEEFEVIDWDTFFEAFDRNGLALLLQESTTDGELSRFCKFVSRNGD